MLHAPSRVAIRATAKAITPEAALIRRCLRAGGKRQPAIWRNVRTPMIREALFSDAEATGLALAHLVRDEMEQGGLYAFMRR
jgi:hypothetical protein